jgi:hypothetical protein
MPEEFEESVYPENYIETMGLDILVLDELEKGKIITNVPSYKESKRDTIHYDVLHLRNFVKEVYQLYAKNPSKAELCTLLEKHRKRKEDDVHNFETDIETLKEHKQFEVIEKKTNKKGEIVIKLKQLPLEDKKKYVKSIVDKIVKTMKPETMRKLFTQSILKLNDIKDLKAIDKALKKKDPVIKGKQGCFKLVVDDHDLFIVG